MQNWQEKIISGVDLGEIKIVLSGRQTGKSYYQQIVNEWKRKMRQTVVHHWSFHDGVTPINPGNQFGETVLPRGWTCWVYPTDNYKFEEWMKRMCPTADVTHRFNSGDPMYTVSITKDSEATAFQLMWM